MKASDWHTLYKIGLGICILLFFFGMIVLIWGYSLVGLGGYAEVGLVSSFVSAIYFLLAQFFNKKFKEAKKLEYEPDPKHQQERSKK